MSIATTRITPTACSALTIVTASSDNSNADSAAGDRPRVCAWTRSKANSVRSRRFATRTASTTAARIDTCQTSPVASPSRFPNSTWCRSIWLGFFEISTTPRANSVVKTMPMVASSLTRLVPRTSQINATAMPAKTRAPSANGTPTR